MSKNYPTDPKKIAELYHRATNTLKRAEQLGESKTSIQQMQARVKKLEAMLYGVKKKHG